MTAYAINKVGFLVERDPAFRARLQAEPAATLAAFPDLAPEEAELIQAGDVAALYRRGGHPFLLQHLARHGIGGLDRQSYRQRIAVVADQG